MSKTIDDINIIETKKKKNASAVFSNPALFQKPAEKKSSPKGIWIAVFFGVLAVALIALVVVSQFHPSSNSSLMDNALVSSESSTAETVDTANGGIAFQAIPHQEIMTSQPQTMVYQEPRGSAEDEIPMTSSIVEPASTTAAETSNTEVSQAPTISGKVFTVQLISYTNTQRAQTAVKKLTDLGYDAFVVSGKKIKSVCVGHFSDKATATQKLSEIKSSLSQYADAYIRTVKA